MSVEFGASEFHDSEDVECLNGLTGLELELHYAEFRWLDSIAHQYDHAVISCAKEVVDEIKLKIAKRDAKAKAKAEAKAKVKVVPVKSNKVVPVKEDDKGIDPVMAYFKGHQDPSANPLYTDCRGNPAKFGRANKYMCKPKSTVVKRSKAEPVVNLGKRMKSGLLQCVEFAKDFAEGAIEGLMSDGGDLSCGLDVCGFMG